MYNIQFKDTKVIIYIPSIKIDSKELYNDIDGKTILIDESFSNFELILYKATLRGKSKVNNYDKYRIDGRQIEGKDNINNYWLYFKRNGKHKEV